MRYGWVKDSNNIAYVDINQFADHFGHEIGLENFRQRVEEFKSNPVKEGVNLKGTKRTTVKLFIPDLYFSEKKDRMLLGDTVWVYLGENYPCYCIYWPDEKK